MQNLSGIFNTPIGQTIAPHLSSKALAKLVEDTLGLERFQLFRDNVAVYEQAETQEAMNMTQENSDVNAMTDTGPQQ
jgi:hypothetical protein